MKDLYTFDLNPSLALATYDEVRETYARLFDELKLPYLIAEADSGDMGGNLSHEFHFPTPKGEDHVISCSNCDYVANEELAESSVTVTSYRTEGNVSLLGKEVCNRPEVKTLVWRGISRDRRTLVNVWYPSPTSPTPLSIPQVNVHAVKAAFPDLDASVEEPLLFWSSTETLPRGKRGADSGPWKLLNLVDCRLPKSAQASISANDSDLPLWPTSIGTLPVDVELVIVCNDPSTQQPLNLLRVVDGDSCPRCHTGKLKVQKAIELGHTFHLGTRYSDPLLASVDVPAEESETRGIEPARSSQVSLQMGCHGIGVSRMIGAVAETLADDKGLNWPRVMAPFEVVIVSGNGLDEAALEVYDQLCEAPVEEGDSQLDLILDDRAESFPWRMQDADLVGYPVIVVVGRRWKAENICEVQCRRLQVRQDVNISELGDCVRSLLAQL